MHFMREVKRTLDKNLYPLLTPLNEGSLGLLYSNRPLDFSIKRDTIFSYITPLSRIPPITINFCHDFPRCSVEFLAKFLAIQVTDLKSMFHLLRSKANTTC